MNLDSKRNIGNKLRQYRVSKGINQKEFASILNISRGTLINYEKGYTNITIDILGKIKNKFPDFNLESIEEEANTSVNKIIQEGYIDLKVLLTILQSGRKFIINTVLIFILAGIAYIFISPQLYRATLTLYPDNETQNSFSQFQNIASTLGMSMPSGKDYNLSIPDIIRSRRIKDAVLDTLWFSHEKNQKISLVSLWSLDKHSFFHFFGKNDSLSIQKAQKEEGRLRLSKRIGVNENRNTGLITITLEIEEPTLASTITEFIAKSAQKFIQKSISQKAMREKKFINERLQLSKKELSDVEEKLNKFQNKNRRVDKSPDLQLIQNRLRREVISKQQVVTTLQQQLEISRIEAVRKKPILYILDHAESRLEPVKPRKTLIILLTIVLGLFTGSIGYFVKK